VITIQATLGRRPVTIHCPQPGDIDPFADVQPLDALQPTEYGLDVESTWMGGAGPWSPGWRCRTVQLAPTDDVAWVFRIDDPDQRDLVRTILLAPGNTFASHTKIDPHAVWVELGADIADRTIDTHVLAIMAAPDDTKGQAKLKPVAAGYDMPELGASQAELEGGVFDRLYREAHPEIGRKAVKATTRDAHGFNTVPVTDETYLRYAGLDALTARRLVPLLAQTTQAPAHVLETEAWLTGEAIRLERRGCLVDLERLEEIASGARVVEEAAAEVVREHAGLNTTQNVKLVQWFGEHGADWSNHPTTDKGAPSLSGDRAKLLLGYPLDDVGRLVAGAYIQHAAISDKLKRTTEVRAAMDPDGFVHPTLYTVGTVTSRMAAAGPNMQNFSKKDPRMRSMFVFRPQYAGLTADFAQIELRVVAALAGEQTMIDTIKAGGDLHQLTADMLDITRQQAKTVNFRIVYGGQGKGLADSLGLPEAEGNRIVREYWIKYPAIAALNEAMMRENGVRLISGRYVPTGTYANGGAKVKANLNYLIQGSAREVLVGAWRRFAIECRRRGLDAQVWFPVHDELVIECAEDIVQEAAALISECMTFDFYGVPVEADADLLLDPEGRWRWSTGDEAKVWAAQRTAA
jgi:DNA polymerase-1